MVVPRWLWPDCSGDMLAKIPLIPMEGEYAEVSFLVQCVPSCVYKGNGHIIEDSGLLMLLLCRC